jgi:hypothetical protein
MPTKDYTVLLGPIEPSIVDIQAKSTITYWIRIHNERSADIGAIRFVPQTKSHQKDTLVCDIVTARFNCIPQIVSRFAGSRNDDGGIAKFNQLPIDLQYGTQVSDTITHAQHETPTLSNPFPLFQTFMSGPLAELPSPDPSRASTCAANISCDIFASLSNIDSSLRAT